MHFYPSFPKMSFIAASVVVLNTVSVFGQTASFRCFTGGHQANCSSFINTFCQSSNNALDIAINNSISLCFNTPDLTSSCFLTAWNNAGTRAVVPAISSCEDALNAVAVECPLGGQAIIEPGGSFTFTLDPDLGSCSSDDKTADTTNAFN